MVKEILTDFSRYDTFRAKRDAISSQISLRGSHLESNEIERNRGGKERNLVIHCVAIFYPYLPPRLEGLKKGAGLEISTFPSRDRSSQSRHHLILQGPAKRGRQAINPIQWKRANEIFSGRPT